MRESRTKLWYFVASIVFCLTIVTSTKAAEPNRILILVSYHPTLRWTNLIVDTIEHELRRSGPGLRIHTEYMDTKRFSDETHYANLLTLLKNKTRQLQYDVIIAVDNNALLFLLKYRDELYPEVPIVFCAVDCYHNSMYEVRPEKTTIEEILTGHDSVTGVMEEFDHETTIETALQLHPSARRIILINDGINKVTYYPNLSEEDVARLTEKFAGRAVFQNLLLTESNLDQVLEKIRKHPGDSIVLLTNSFLDRQAHLSLLNGKLPTFWQRCDAPVYVVSRSLLELGHPVGGYINSDKAQGTTAADMALRILKGESASNIPIVHKSPNDYFFKYPEMKRFDIDITDLPRGSRVLNQPESFYYKYKGRIWAVAAIITGLALMVVILLINILRRKAAEKRLRVKNIAIESSINAIAFADVKGKLTDVNDAFLSMWRYRTKKRVLGKSVVKFWADESKAVQVSETVKSKGSWIGELTAKRRDGSTFDAEVSASLVKDEAGNPICMMASFIDITEQKTIKDALQEIEQRHRELTEGLKELVYRADPDTLEPTYVNRAVKDLYGYTPEDWLADPKLWQKTIHPDDSKRVVDKFAEAKEKAGKGIVEYRIIRKDKEVRWVEDHFAWEKDLQGRIHSLYGTMYDITERKTAEEKIVRAKEEWERTFMTVPDLIAIIDRDYRIVRVNKAMAERMGVAPEEAAGMICYECIHRTKEPPAFCPHVRLLANGQGHTEEVYEEHLGGDFVVSVSPLRNDDGSLMGCVHVARD
ncbi:MAG: ABC transporter substrate binding protein, partial [Planctomycetota bacterium]